MNCIDMVVMELSKFGVFVILIVDGFIIEGKVVLKSGEVDSYGDYWIGMMFVVVVVIVMGEVILMRSEVIYVFYFIFFEDFDKLSE